jgi:predicted nucleic acid-binding protein
VIFIDTSAWYAASSTRDVNHRDAVLFLGTIREQLFTSDYVIDETLTLFRSRSEDQHALAFGNEVIEGGFAKVIKITDQDFVKAWDVFQKFSDKQWSFTDCTSRVVMERFGIQKAFAFDDHFRQFSTVTVVP